MNQKLYGLIKFCLVGFYYNLKVRDMTKGINLLIFIIKYPKNYGNNENKGYFRNVINEICRFCEDTYNHHYSNCQEKHRKQGVNKVYHKLINKFVLDFLIF